MTNTLKDFPNTPMTFGLAFTSIEKDYDGGKQDFELTATTLISNSIRDIVKGVLKVPKEPFTESIRTKAALGSLIHEAVEKRWEDFETAKEILIEQGLDPEYVNNLKINSEVRSFKEIKHSESGRNYIISGKYDFVINGRVVDLKTTSTFVVEHGVKDSDYRMQLSIYRWLNPEVITDDIGEIHAYFRDFKNISETTRAKRSRPYPKADTEVIEYQLHSAEYIDDYIKALINLIDPYVEYITKGILHIEDVPDEKDCTFDYDPLSKKMIISSKGDVDTLISI